MSQQASSDSGKGSARGLFSGNIGFILAVAGSAVGLGNIWRFPYLAAKYGGGIFLLVYLILMLTFGYALIVAETSLGRKTRLSPVGAYRAFGQMKRNPFLVFGGWINAVVPMLILPYYCLIGGWIIKYLFEYVVGDVTLVAGDGYFGSFISSPFEPIIWNLIFLGCTLGIILKGVEGGIERASRVMMPLLLILAVIVAVYSMTRPGAGAGIYYYLVPDFSKFSIMTVVAACGQLFFSLSIGMGILITYGSYMKKDVNVEQATYSIGFMDTLVATLAGFMIIPAVFAFSGGTAEALNAGPSLMFITIPKIFESMDFGGIIGAVFFLMVFFAALTSSISIMETCVSTLTDELHWSRRKSALFMTFEAIALGVPCSLGFGVWDFISIAGLSILDMMDFLASLILCPLAAMLTCLLIGRIVGIENLISEVKISSAFHGEKIFRICISWLAPLLLLVVLVSSVAATLGIIKI
ncbi:sodium-dependent transporter [uncultured Mailhella sp.]|uniref:sodium-dependent transporter n=1 Tax=uncultured Mailhella sp. TaxID=1981031 RepID=UPI0025CF544B|nr:sodium-dependent transporter [uncultured Mailhella sp.]